MTARNLHIHTGVKLNEPIVINADDIVQFDDIDNEEIIAISHDDYQTSQDMIKLYDQEKSAFVNAMKDMHESGEDVIAFTDNPWFPQSVIDDINYNWQPDDSDIESSINYHNYADESDWQSGV